MKLPLEDKIPLQFGDTRKHLQPHEINADGTDKEIAISNLVKHGYVTAHENGSSRYGRYVSISITTEGKARQRERYYSCSIGNGGNVVLMDAKQLSCGASLT